MSARGEIGRASQTNVELIEVQAHRDKKDGVHTTQREVQADVGASKTAHRHASASSTADDAERASAKLIEVDADLEPRDDPELRDILPEVLRVVSLHDDTSLPTLTFRYFVLSLVFVLPGAFLSQMNTFRTTYAPYSVFFVQIASNYVGIWLARVLPAKLVKVPLIPWSFNLNPGPWNSKEHVLVTITAASGATGSAGVTPIALAELYYNEKVHPAAAIAFMLAIVWIGYAFAAIARQVLLYDPAYPWFQAYVPKPCPKSDLTMFRSLHR